MDLLTARFDVAFRSGVREDAELFTRVLVPLELVVCAAPDYLARRGTPAALAELANYDCLDFAASSTPGVWRFEGEDGVLDVEVRGPLRANGGASLKAAALSGVGVILKSYILVCDDIQAGRLVPLLADFGPESRPVHLLTHPDRHPTPKLPVSVEAILDKLGTKGALRSVTDPSTVPPRAPKRSAD